MTTAFPASIVLCLALLSPAPAAAQDDTGKGRKLTDDEKIELIRGLMAEYVTVKTYLPRSKKALKFSSAGEWDKREWQEAGREFGPVARVGDLVQITKVDVNDDNIVFQINGGLNTRGKWYERIDAGVGGGGGGTPIGGGKLTTSAGTAVELKFPGRVPVVGAAEIKKMLAPLFDFDRRSATENYFDTLPPEVQQAIKSKKVLIGMDKEQVVLAVGRPRDRIRETKEGIETEDWIYGFPPGKISFVTFGNGKVIALKDSYAGLGGNTGPPLKPPQ